MKRYQISYEDLQLWRAGDSETIARVRREAVAAAAGPALIVDQDDHELERVGGGEHVAH